MTRTQPNGLVAPQPRRDLSQRIPSRSSHPRVCIRQRIRKSRSGVGRLPPHDSQPRRGGLPDIRVAIPQATNERRYRDVRSHLTHPQRFDRGYLNTEIVCTAKKIGNCAHRHSTIRLHGAQSCHTSRVPWRHGRADKDRQRVCSNGPKRKSSRTGSLWEIRIIQNPTQLSESGIRSLSQNRECCVTSFPELLGTRRPDPLASLLHQSPPACVKSGSKPLPPSWRLVLHPSQKVRHRFNTDVVDSFNTFRWLLNVKPPKARHPKAERLPVIIRLGASPKLLVSNHHKHHTNGTQEQHPLRLHRSRLCPRIDSQ